LFKNYFTLIKSILVVLLLGSCATNAGKQEQAHQALQVFFERLAGCEYEAAVALFGGSCETLVSFNPALNLDDQAALWQSGCQVNSLQCLTVRTAFFTEVSDTGEYIFTIEFNAHDGSLFVLDGCCGENPTTPPQSQFEYRVVEGGDGRFRVLDLSVYIP
jgi:hypothetical protein